MIAKIVKDLKVGDLFRRKDDENAKIFIRGSYVRENKRFSCIDYDDSNHEMFFKGDKLVFVM